MKNFFLFTLTVALLFIWGCEPGWRYQIIRPQAEKKERYYELSFNDLNLQIESRSIHFIDVIKLIISTEADSATLKPGIISLQRLSQPEHIHAPAVSLVLHDVNNQVIAEEKATGMLIPREPISIKRGQKLYLSVTSFTIQSVGTWNISDTKHTDFLFHYYFPDTDTSFKCVFAIDLDRHKSK